MTEAERQQILQVLRAEREALEQRVPKDVQKIFEDLADRYRFDLEQLAKR